MHRLTRKKIPAADTAGLRRAVERTFPGLRPRAEQGCAFSYIRSSPALTVKLYTTGTFYVEGAVEADVELARTLIDGDGGSAPTVAAATSRAWIGTDECGKGDYFGPLVVAAVAIDREMADAIDRLHVRDSKAISDVTIRALASKLHALLGDRAEVLALDPPAYNDAMEREPFRANAARLLGAMHAGAINALAARYPVDEIVVDKFGREEHVRADLTPEAWRIRFTMVPHAERDPAVAAASVLARNAFLQAMEQLSDAVGFDLPKGASIEVERTVSELVRDIGLAGLRRFAKLHFKTTGKL